MRDVLDFVGDVFDAADDVGDAVALLRSLVDVGRRALQGSGGNVRTARRNLEVHAEQYAAAKQTAAARINDRFPGEG